MRRRLRAYAADAARALEHAPVETGLALLLAVAFSLAIETDTPESMRVWLETAVLVLLAGAAAWAATLLRALDVVSQRVRWAITLAGLVLAAVYGLVWLDLEHGAEAWRAAALVAAAWLFVAWAPALAGSDGAARSAAFRDVGGRFVVRLIGAALYGAGLFVGLALAIGAVNTLFELGMEGRIYGHVFGWIAFALIPLVVFGGVELYAGAEPAHGDRLRAVTHRLITWLVVPLVIVYYGILCAYVVRIVITRELPHNLVSPMVIAAGLLSAVALVLIDPRPAEDARDRLMRAIPWLFLPLAVLGGWAILARVGQYGWTEFRYLRLVLLGALALLAGAAALASLRRRALALHLVPVVPALLLVLGSVGPWSAQAVSLRSQRDVLGDALARAGFDDAPLPVSTTAPAPADTVPAELYETIRSTSSYLVDSHGPDALEPWLTPPVDREVARSLPHFLGLVAAGPRPGTPRSFFVHLRPGEPVGTGRGRVQRVTLADRRQVLEPDGAGGLPLGVPLNGATYRVDLGGLVHSSAPHGPDGALPPDLAVLPLLDPDGAPAGELLILDLGMTREAGEGGWRLMRLDALARLDAGAADSAGVGSSGRDSPARAAPQSPR